MGRRKFEKECATAILAMTLSGCAATGTIVKSNPIPLDQSLAAECKKVADPNFDDFDLLVAWAVDLTIQYGDCAARHRKTVEAWPR